MKPPARDPRPARPLRLWPAIVLVVLQAFAVFAIPRIAPATPLHFFGAVGGAFLGTLLVLLWWLALSRAPWRERLAGFGVVTVAFAGTLLLVDPSTVQALLTKGLPLVCLTSVLWLALARGRDVRQQRIGAVAVLVAVLLPWTLVRSNGVDGAIANDYAWRWTPTAEERFLETAAAEAPDPLAVAPPVSLPPTEDAAWPGFRGRGRDSRVEGVRIATDWETTPPETVWRRPVGPGWGSFALAGRRLFTQEQRAEAEVVACYDARDGSPLWIHEDPARFWESMAGPGPRATPTYADGRLYTVGATGIVNALDAATGERYWSRDLVADAAAPLPTWGFSCSPVVAEGLVIVFAGGPDDKGVVAYDARTGDIRWTAPAGQLSYSSPHLATIGGTPQVLMVTGDGVRGLAVRTGAVLWTHAWPLPGGARIVQPLVLNGERVLIGTGMGQGVRSLAVANDGGAWIVDEGWTSRAMKPYYNDFVEHRGQLYGFDGSILASVDAVSGERNWKKGRYGNGQLLLLVDQDLLLVLSEEGDVVLVGADPTEFREIARVPAIEGKTWNHPVLVEDRLYVRNAQEAACLRLQMRDPVRTRVSAPEPRPATTDEAREPPRAGA